MTSHSTQSRGIGKSKKSGSHSRRSFGKKLLASGVAFGLAPLAIPNVAAASGDQGIVPAPVNKLQALIQEQLYTYLGGTEAGGNSVDAACNDEIFHIHLGLRLM